VTTTGMKLREALVTSLHPVRDSPGHTNVTTKRMSEMDWLWYSFMFERFLFEKDRKANISFSNRHYYEACII